MLPHGFAYLPDFLSHDEERVLVALLEKEPFAPLHVRGQRTRRETVSYGREFKPYLAVLPPAPPVPCYLHRFRNRAARYAKIKAATLAQALITKYPEGSNIGWHRDHASFGALVLCVSLLGPATLYLRQAGVVDRVKIAPRSLYILRDDARANCEHKLVADSLRYSVTLRPFA